VSRRTVLAFVITLCASALAGPARGGAVAEVGAVLDDWHRAAAEANLESYFGHLAPDAVFLGTDATERWTVSEFRAYAEPHFARGQGWTFRPHARHVGLSADESLAWVDEQLDSDKYGRLRGTAVLRRENGAWRIVHYSMSFTIPNDVTPEAVAVIRGAAVGPAKP
jgi:ketosteroid isomerase-like protein